MPTQIEQARRIAVAVQQNVERVMVGKTAVVELVLVALATGGHLLLEDVPGTGKTTLAKALARSLDCSMSRIQFTPDLLPSDVTGVNVYQPKSGEFQFRPGPIFQQIVLADEINRATPRTQSALLECMEERQVSVDGITRPLPLPHLVLATQNPVEQEGTFPLPEAQLDRFLMRLSVGYPAEVDELHILERFGQSSPLVTLQPVATTADVLALQAAVTEVHVAPAIKEYIVALVRATRNLSAVQLGASPRATLALYRTAQALAALRGRAYVLPDDVLELALPVLGHRLLLTGQARLRGQGSAGVVAELLEKTPVPAEPLEPTRQGV